MPRLVWVSVRVGVCALALMVCLPAESAQTQSTAAQVAQANRERRVPGRNNGRGAAVLGLVRIEGSQTHGVPGATVALQRLPGGRIYKVQTDGEGIFRLSDLPPGNYEIKVDRDGFSSSTDKLRVGAGSIFILKMELAPLTAEAAESVVAAAAESAGPYRELVRQPEQWAEEIAAGALPSPELVFQPRPNRWEIPHPEGDRYGFGGEHPWVDGKPLDPYNQNRWKGDLPIFGRQVFLNFTGVSDTFMTARRLYVPSGASAEDPGSTDFFGEGAQGFLAQTFRLSFDLFRGDTSFRPFDWRVRFTPAFNINYLHALERGVVNFDVRKGTTRFDGHAGIQEAFFEAKVKDLSPEFDFVSVRAGIQPFNSDFRGLVFVDEQPGVRVFGTLNDSRWEYNAAYFYFLEKDTNSLLNSFEKRHQQVALANLYIQDFIKLGYTTQFSFHYNKDDADFHFDKNNFLVRPQPIGAVQPHDIRSYYIGWAGNGHLGRLNISHAFYQVLGRDELNPLAGREVDINAQLAALELSIDKDWVRLRGAAMYASGDDDPLDGTARGFDAILDVPAFAGGIFSFFNRESIRLTGTGVALMPPNSFLPNLRSSKDEGQANHVNPGLWLYHAGADIELTPKLRSFVNANFMRFDHTEPLELLLFQAPIDPWMGADYSVGFQYRPPLTDNMIVTTGFSALTPWAGLRRIYQDKTVFGMFVLMRLQF